MRLLLAALVSLVAGAAPAHAFASVQVGASPHDEITAVAADLGWPEEAVEALQEAVRRPDLDDLQKVDGSDRKAPSVTFRPWHHCGRVPPTSDLEAANATVQYVAQERELALALALLDPDAAVRALGRALHALQDCFSHSNIVDLTRAEQGALAAAFVTDGAVPPRLKVCGIAPDGPDIERPAGDVYSHADFNKDDDTASPEAEAPMPDGRSKHEHAAALATNATRAFLVDVMGRLEAEEAKAILDVRGPEGRASTLGLPVMPAGSLALAVVAAATLARRDRP